MSDAQERTERPTPRRLRKAREQGDTPHSALAAYAAGCLALPAVAVAGKAFASAWIASFTTTLHALDGGRPATAAALQTAHLLPSAAVAAGTAWLVACAGAVAAAASCGGLTFAPAALRCRFDKLTSSLGLRALAPRGNLAQTSVALCAVIAVTAAALRPCAAIVLDPHPLTWQAWCSIALAVLTSAWWRITLALCTVAMADVVFARRRHANALRMTAREVRDERAEHEGKPEHKSRRRSIAVRRSRRLRLAAVKRAAAVVVNPTHVAVALEYAPPAIDVPLVSALAAGPSAAILRTAAAYYDVPIVASPDVARALFVRAEVDDPIPEDLYAAVAAIFAWIVRTRGRLGGNHA